MKVGDTPPRLYRDALSNVWRRAYSAETVIPRRKLYQRCCLWFADRLCCASNWFIGQAYPSWRGR